MSLLCWPHGLKPQVNYESSAKKTLFKSRASELRQQNFLGLFSAGMTLLIQIWLFLKKNKKKQCTRHYCWLITFWWLIGHWLIIERVPVRTKSISAGKLCLILQYLICLSLLNQREFSVSVCFCPEKSSYTITKTFAGHGADMKRTCALWWRGESDQTLWPLTSDTSAIAMAATSRWDRWDSSAATQKWKVLWAMKCVSFGPFFALQLLFLRHIEALCPGLWGFGGVGDKRLSYSITWFCSWSPCVNCSIRLSQFLSRMPNLRLRIFVSRLYFCDMEDSREREGLRMLTKAGVQISVMSYKGECSSNEGVTHCIDTLTVGHAAWQFCIASLFFRLFLLLANICGS